MDRTGPFHACSFLRHENPLSTTSRYHRAPWGTAVRIDENLTRIRLKNSRGHLMVNTYAWLEDDIFMVIDPGWPWTLDALEQALKDLELGEISDVTHWLYTHTHIDHMGLTAILGERTDAAHLIAESVEPHLLTWHAFQDRMNDWSDWAAEAFASPAREQIAAMMRKDRASGNRRTMVEVWGPARARNTEFFSIGEVLSIGSLNLEVIDASGHDPMHVAFFERARGWLFVGDAVLAVPTPISRAMDDDLAMYEATLDRLESLGATALFPGHGTQLEGDAEQIKAAIQRSRQYVLDHRAALRAALEALDAPSDLLSLAIALTPDGKPYEPLTRWYVHVSSTDAHLHWLVDRGEVERIVDDSGPRYRSIS